MIHVLFLEKEPKNYLSTEAKQMRMKKDASSLAKAIVWTYPL